MLRIHKPGQGYWLRMLSALGFGALIAAGAMWLWGELKAADIPVVAYDFTLETPLDSLNPGDQIALFGPEGAGQPVGTANVQESRDNGENIIIADWFFEPEFQNDESTATITHIAPAGTPIDGASEIEQRQGIEAFNKIYLQGGVAIGVIALGAIFLLFLCYANRPTVDFLIATENEMKKVNWSTRREVFGSTWVVITISVLIAIVLLSADLLFSSFFRAIDLLESG